MEITKRYLKQIIKEELTRVLLERAMYEEEALGDEDFAKQGIGQKTGGETAQFADPKPAADAEGGGEKKDAAADPAQQAQAKKKGPTKLSGEAHKYRRHVNGLKKKGKIDKAGWRKLRRALHKMDMTNPQQNQKFNQLLKQTVVATQKAGGGDATAAKGGGGDFNKKLATDLPTQDHGNAITDPELKARYIAKVKELAKDPQLNILAKKVAVNPASWLRNQVFKRANKLMAAGKL
jgi:hypothetical protein